MKSLTAWVLVLVAVLAAAGGGYWFGHRGAAAGKDEESSSESKAEEKPVATVTVVPIRRAMISEQIAAYGTVVAPPSEVQVVSVPFESRVTRLLVAPGQTVSAGQALIDVQASAATALAFEEARNAVAAAQHDLQLVKQRYEQKLATSTELFNAENTLRLAQGRLQSLQQGGAGGPRQLVADAPGIVSKIDVQMGQVVAAGNPLVEVAAQNRIEARLGAQPGDVPYLKPGQSVQLLRTEDPTGDAVEGKIRVIGQRVDPMTRLIDVMVALPPDAKVLLESFVTGRMTRASAYALVAPRDAVLPVESGQYTLFTVKDNKAVKHAVHVGIENDQEAQVIADDLKEGDLAVVVGNYELDDGMAVKAQAAAEQPTTTAPAGPEPPATSPAQTMPASTEPATTSPASQIGGAQ